MKATTFEELAQEALREEISWNTFVNRILDDYVNFERYAKRVKVMRASPSTLSIFLNEIPDEVVAHLGVKRGASNVVSVLASLGQPHTLDNIVKLVVEYMDKYLKWCDGQITKLGEVWLFHLRHPVNRKWSIFLCKYVIAMFEKFDFMLLGEPSIHDYSVTFNLQPPKPNAKRL